MLIKFFKITLLTLLLLTILSPAYTDDTKIIINIPSRTLELWENNKIHKIYPIGVGTARFPSPIGNFMVISKVKNPGWENPFKAAGEIKIKAGKNNPLGTRWIGFNRSHVGEYGIHGTNEPSSVGKFCSHGCIRMLIKNSEEVYNKVDIDTPVKVTYYPYKLKVINNTLFIQKFPNAYKRKINIKESVSNQLSMIDQNYHVDYKQFSLLKNLKDGQKIKIGYIIPDDISEISIETLKNNLIHLFNLFKIRLINMLYLNKT